MITILQISCWVCQSKNCKNR